MNKRVAVIDVGINSLLVKEQYDATQGDKNTHFIELTFNNDVELENWKLIVYFKTPYPSIIVMDAYENLTQTMNISIPYEVLSRHGKLEVEFSLHNGDKSITVNKHLDINVLRTISGTYISSNIGSVTQNTISNQIKELYDLLGKSEKIIDDFNDNVEKKTDEFNNNFKQKIIELENIIPKEVRKYIEQNKEQLKGDSGKISNVTATIDNNVGIPNVEVILGGTPSDRDIQLNFKNLKGEGINKDSILTQNEAQGIINKYI